MAQVVRNRELDHPWAVDMRFARLLVARHPHVCGIFFELPQPQTP
jgi:hypothetical protein